ncbi:Na+/H+ antiporter NhaC family protein [Thermovenabulum sp.]|uniref:Na+/H+ antiporter NhaC family protein n=1 Tax=Thermovenabulum sp. TaxID=3100335 RepID=UPI003C7E3AEF
MEHYGFLSVLPPLIAILLAIVTKEVLISLTAGIFVGTLILSNGNVFQAFISAFDIAFEKVGDASWNARTLLYVFFLGGVLGLATRSGGAKAFADFIANKIKSRKSAQTMTLAAGLFIFFDDYFNCLTVGSVLKPVTDKFRVSREKLSFITDATAAPVCILAPISTWVAYIIGLLSEQFQNLKLNNNAFVEFVKTIPVNFYSWLMLLMIVVIIFTKLEYGPMAKAEIRTIKTGQLYNPDRLPPPGLDTGEKKVSEKGKGIDMIFPIAALIIIVFLFMLYTGGYFEGGKSVGAALQSSDSVTALVYGSFLTLTVTILFYKIRGVLNILEAMDAVVEGMKSMMVGNTILVLAWIIGGVTSKLGTGAYVSEVVKASMPVWLIPFSVFIVSCIMAFATGTSWGTFAVMVPLVVPVAISTNISLTMVLAALFSGAIFGDHCSPLSDTTILSSTGAGCPHIDHVNTQLPYALTAASCAGLGFLLFGITKNPVISFIAALAAMVILMFVMGKINAKQIDEIEKYILELEAGKVNE